MPPVDWPTVAAILTGASLLLLVAAAVALPRVLATLPSDYLVRDDETLVGAGAALARNVAAGLLLVAGIAMLVLPGQGILTILAALVVSTLPGKQRATRWMLAQGPILRAVEWIRHRAGAAPLILPKDADD